MHKAAQRGSHRASAAGPVLTSTDLTDYLDDSLDLPGLFRQNLSESLRVSETESQAKGLLLSLPRRPSVRSAEVGPPLPLQAFIKVCR